MRSQDAGQSGGHRDRAPPRSPFVPTLPKVAIGGWSWGTWWEMSRGTRRQMTGAHLGGLGAGRRRGSAAIAAPREGGRRSGHGDGRHHVDLWRTLIDPAEGPQDADHLPISARLGGSAARLGGAARRLGGARQRGSDNCRSPLGPPLAISPRSRPLIAPPPLTTAAAAADAAGRARARVDLLTPTCEVELKSTVDRTG